MLEQYRTDDRRAGDYVAVMSDPNSIHIVSVEQDGEYGILVTFSDGTTAGYIAEELLELRPSREHVRPTPKDVG
jgi:DUF971 family protein